MTITKRIFAGTALSLLAAQPLFAQDTVPETSRGTYLVYGDEGGAAFVSYEPSLAATNVWPLEIFFYDDENLTGSARMTSRGDCRSGTVQARLTHRAGPDGISTMPTNADPAMFSFARSEGSGDAEIVNFVCGDTNSRLAQASAPIFGPPSTVARIYAELRAAGINDRLARDLAIRDPESNGPLIDTAVPENMREAVHGIMAGAHPD